MKGSNGLAPRDVIERSTKCPEAPGKRKFHTLIEAEKAAAFSSAQYHKTIVPYACSGCGMWHVTGKVRGSDVAVSRPSGVIKTAAMQQRENLKPVVARPERKDMSEVIAMESPIVPGNREARLKMAREYLEGRESVTGPEMMELLSSSRQVANAILNELGWSGARGHANWLPPGVERPAPLEKSVKKMEAAKVAKKGGRSSNKAIAARHRKLKAFLKDKTEVSRPEIEAFLGASSKNVRRDMHAVGWVAERSGTISRWVPADSDRPVAPVRQLHAVQVDEQPEQVEQPAQPVSVPDPSDGWRNLASTDKVAGMTIAQMNDTLSAFGLEVRLQIREVR
jgi:hypothetical protein